MTKTDAFLPLTGVYAPNVTPFRPTDGELDLPWMARHIHYLAAHRCNGVVACGTNGEAPSLSVGERRRVLEAALEAAGTLSVVAGTGAAALPDAVALTRHAFAAGAAGVLIMPPFYFKRPADDAVAAWYRRLFDAAVPTGGRVLLYHIPQLTGVPISNTVLELLQASHPGVVYGIKDSTGDPAERERLRSGFPGLAYFAGNDHLVADAIRSGGAGSISAAANIFPDLVAATQDAARQGGDADAAQAQLSIARRLMEGQPLQAATKYALTIVAGLPLTAVRPPQSELSAEAQQTLREALEAQLTVWRPATVGAA